MKALYHQPAGSVELEVIGKPKGGLADLGREGQMLVIGVSISKAAVLGACTLVEDEDPQKAAKAAAIVLRKKATEAAKAAVNARKAADAAKGKANEAELVEAAEEAELAAKKADTEADEAEAKLKE